ncbi:Type I inositol 1,4,5-trisphosphate 5-phosphatase CVP2 [Platanthera zijinensis]|uniref:Type I inositol 1,4,5-trisphosphate 5-phosphatase CVP2 n=1 Tax=Platanthera zijinensis TaxID=2320716 RepID=A0AAP0FYT3_9ASPA
MAKRMFVGTWNVGGRAPDSGLNLRELLTFSSSSPADIYVLGFQEIVPLNAGNVLVAEDRGPAGQWLSLIRKALNPRRTQQDVPENYYDAAGLNPVSFDRTIAAGEEFGGFGAGDGYRLVACKQMVGIFLCVWVRASLFRHVSNVRVSKIVWLGDLNYRLEAASSWDETLELLHEKDWKALLERDQLKGEQRGGRVLAGWEEGIINFPPTYKYLANSDSYAIRLAKSGGKRRAPAWCDRILWQGKGMKQQWYRRGESRFSDHRPVYALFAVDLDGDYTLARPSAGSSSAAWGKVQAEEILLLSRAQSCIETASRF